MQFVDPSIILAGRGPNVANALAGGLQSGVALRDARYTGQYRNALSQHGAGALQGNQESRNALAAFDPAAMQGMAQTDLAMDQTRLGMQETQQRMQLARETGAREAQRYASELSAAQAAQAAEEYRRALQPLMMAQTPEEWARAAQASGIDPSQAPWEMRDVILAQEFGAAEVLDLRAKQQDLEPQAPSVPSGFQSLQMRAEAAGLVPGTSEYQSFMLNGGEVAESLTVYGPDGRPIMQQGKGAQGGAAFTEGQSKDIGFAARARAALGVFEGIPDGADAPISDTLTSRVQGALGAVPLGMGRGFQDPNYQVAENAGTNFLLAILRKDTGAAVTPSEEGMYGRIFLPRPGDSVELLAQKRQAREMAIAGLEQGMSIDQIAAQARAMQAGTGGDPQGGTQLGPVRIEAESTNAAPQPGTIDGGFQFLGGDPADPNSWRPVNG